MHAIHRLDEVAKRTGDLDQHGKIAAGRSAFDIDSLPVEVANRQSIVSMVRVQGLPRRRQFDHIHPKRLIDSSMGLRGGWL
ncbi:MAG: hypothetical protein FJX52_13980, partial [Alphaproteobacteria bacterium]|nr:hypothetical protein [Alphaproteobacteria bacterium]